jgi:DNA repair ATPase RecN
MDKQEMERVVSNLDHRVDRVEQILPTLATKDDLQAAIEPLATKAELQAAIEPLATKAELQATKVNLGTAIAEAEQRMRTHFDVVTESLHDDVRLIATGMADLSQRMHQLRGELKTDLAGIDRRLMRVEARGAAR